MKRCRFVALLDTALAAPLPHAQAPEKIRRIRVFWPGDSSVPDARIDALREGLRELGYVEGQNIAIVYRYAEGKYECLPALAADLVREQVEVVVGAGAPAISAAQKATTTIPIVMGTAGDPVGTGLVKHQ